MRSVPNADLTSDTTMLHPNQFSVNEAWIAFQLNTAAIRTEDGGSFHCLALMDAASCFLLGSQMVSADSLEPSTLEVRRLLKTAQSHKKQLPKTLFIAHESPGDAFAREAKRQRIAVVRVPQAELLVFVGEAQEGFRERFG